MTQNIFSNIETLNHKCTFAHTNCPKRKTSFIWEVEVPGGGGRDLIDWNFMIAENWEVVDPQPNYMGLSSAPVVALSG